jgi:hypothetical protein
MPSTLLEREADVVSALRLLLFEAGATKTPAECSIGADLRTAMGSSVSGLAAVAIMGERLGAHTAEAPRRRGTDEARASLFLRLAAQFERMHRGQRFTVSNRYVPEARHGERDNVPAGPAFDWVRALFELAAGRAAEGPDGRPFQELADLARWAAETPDGLAKRIQRARARLRERQRPKPRRAFPRREPRVREPHRKKP